MSAFTFISYSHADHAYVTQLVRYLRDEGIEVWTDEGIERGDDWAATIESQLRLCAAFIPVMSPDARRADWVRREILRAQELHKPILPLRLSGDRFLELLNVQDEDVWGGVMPSRDFVRRLNEVSYESLVASSTTSAVTAAATRERRELGDDIAELARYARGMLHANPLVAQFVRLEIQRLTQYLRLLSQGADVTYEGEDQDWLLSLTRSAARTIDGVTLTTVDAGFGDLIEGGQRYPEFGQRHFQTQAAAVQRGVTVRRLFIADRSGLAELDSLQGIIEMLHRIGVQVRSLVPSDSRPLRHVQYVDFVVFDHGLVYQLSPGINVGDISRPNIVYTRIVTQLDRVRSDVALFEELWIAATPFEPH